MIRLFVSLFLFFMSSYAQSTLNYTISEGKLHKGGNATVEIKNETTDTFDVFMEYKLIKKVLVPIPDDALSGDNTITLPIIFKDERGYLELEHKKEMVINKNKLVFAKRANFRNYKDAYIFNVLPKNGRTKIEVAYHPSIPSTGWGEINVMFISPIPIINGYKIKIESKP